MRKVLLRVSAALLLLLLSVGSVSAHAKLIKASPAPGSVQGQAPARVQLWFDENVEPLFSEVQVLDKARTRVDAASLELAPDDPKSIIIPLKSLADGTYSVVWKVLSATDGHITRGVFAFSVGNVAGPSFAPLGPDASPSELSPLGAVARGVSLIALLALVGGFFFRLFLLDRSLDAVDVQKTGTDHALQKVGHRGGVREIVDARWRQLTGVVLTLTLIGNAVELLLQANLIAEQISLQALSDVLFDTRFGTLWLLRIFLLIAIGTVLYARTRRARILIPAISFVTVAALFFVANSLSLTRGIFLSRLFQTQGLTPVQQIALALHHLGLFVPFIIFFGIAFYQRYNLIGILPLVGILALLTRALASHGAAAEGDLSIAMVSDWLHLIAVAVWVGGLFHFAFLMPYVWRALEASSRGKWIAWIVPQFSIAAIVATATIAITGLYNSLIELPALDALARTFKIPSVNDLVGTLYGGTLALKVALFGVMIAFGAVNLLFISPNFRRAISAPEKSARLFSRFRLTVGAEVLLGLSAIFLAGMLTIETPARSEVAPAGPAPAQNGNANVAPLLLVGTAAPDVRVQLVAGPNPGAPTQFDARVTDPSTGSGQAGNDKPTTNVLRVIFNFTLLDSDTGVQNVIAEPREDGHYVVSGNYLSLDGMWRVRVVVRRKGVEDVSIEFPIYLVPPSATKPDDPQARALLLASEQRMNKLTSLRSVQQLNDGSNGVVVTDYEYHAPDRVRFTVEGQANSIAIGAQQYYQDQNGQWSQRARVDPFVFPKFDQAAQAKSVELGRAENVGDEPAQIVRFAIANSSGGGDIHYAYWISKRDQRLLQFAMQTESHYMMQYYTDYNAPNIAIDAPANVAPPTAVALAPNNGDSGTNSARVLSNGRARGFITGDLEGDGALILLVAGIVIGLVGNAARRERRARLTAMGIGIACTLAGIWMFVDAVNATTSSAANAPVSTQSALAGQTVYQQNCTSCHGASGKGDGPAAGSLPVKPFDLTTHVLLHDEQYLHAVILNGRGYMPAWGDRLTQDQISEVIAYIRSLALKAQRENPRPGFTPQAP